MEEIKQKSKSYILVIDGNVDDRFLLSMFLQRFGYDICTASTTADAIEFMNVAPPVAIVAEAIMGASLVSRIKIDNRFLGVTIILVAAIPNLDLELRTRRGEFAAILSKPLDVEKIYQVIQATVEKTPRKHIRINTALEVTFGVVAGGVKGYVSVLSEYGMFIRMYEPQDLHAIIPISFKLKDQIISLEAVVLYSYALEASPFREPGIGVKFVKISPEDHAFIKQYILEQIQEGIAR